jgi:hypothetical protein
MRAQEVCQNHLLILLINGTTADHTLILIWINVFIDPSAWAVPVVNGPFFEVREIGYVHSPDQTREAVELVTVDAVTAGIAVDSACLHPDRPIGRKLAEGFSFEQEMWERIGAGGDAGQRVQRNASATI